MGKMWLGARKTRALTQYSRKVKEQFGVAEVGCNCASTARGEADNVLA
jgi:hypothetical protein